MTDKIIRTIFMRACVYVYNYVCMMHTTTVEIHYKNTIRTRPKRYLISDHFVGMNNIAV